MILGMELWRYDEHGYDYLTTLGVYIVVESWLSLIIFGICMAVLYG